MPEQTPLLHGIAAEFTSVSSIEAAAGRALEAGFTRIEAYTPFDVESLTEALHPADRRVAFCTLMGGITGGATGFGMCWYAFAVFFPLDIGGRPNNSWPAWIPITFEMTVLFAALSAVVTMLILNGLPRLHHPVFEIPGFERASRDRFFLCIEARDPRFDPGAIRALFLSLDALRISEVPA